MPAAAPDTLPNAASAVIELRKLAEYCLNPSHPRGRHKARVFQASLGIFQSDAEWLRDAILAAIMAAPAVLESRDRYGDRYRADFPLTNGSLSAVVCTIWLVPPGAVPRLITCYVL